MAVLSLTDLNLFHKKVLVRVELNVPLNEDGSIADLMRISESIPTLRFLLEKEASIVLLSHFGKPEGKRGKKYSLKPFQKVLSEMLGQEVLFEEDVLGKETKKRIENLKPKEILLLENLRFYPAEEHPEIDPSFAQTLASYGDIYINDAFGGCHRKHSSITSLPKAFPKAAAAGFLVEKEIQALRPLYSNPEQPFHAIIGGSKVSSKLKILESLIEKVQVLYIGGGMAFTFLKALGHSIGKSILEPDLLPAARSLIEQCEKKGITLFLPQDIVIADSFSAQATKKIINTNEKAVPENWQGMDIGPKTLIEWEKSLTKAKTIFWNGPVGVFEWAAFSKGTFSLAKFLSKLPSYRVVGGGDSASAIHQLGIDEKFTYISTGGGASLEFLEQGTLPGIAALTQK
ncbi:MAG: phosphoglycerate kinase [Rhabdochlamydiaceae bacterium]|nr:phosphoglycerate kinase [Rhabdochlamydiaceae bacterium]